MPESEISNVAFENWWSNTAIPQVAAMGKTPDELKELREVAFAAWEHQRISCATVIKNIIQTIKDSTL